jgi:hypothetical protein
VNEAHCSNRLIDGYSSVRFFAHLIYAIAEPLPSLDPLLRDAYLHSAIQANAIGRDP